MKVKRYDYAAQFGDRLPSLVADIECILNAGHYVLSDHVKRFEQAFASYLGSHHVIGVNSGTDALVLSLMCIGISQGDEVITQANTFHATAAAICLCGAKPVLVDVMDDSFQIDQQAALSAVTERTRAIIPVHLYGYPADLHELLAGARRHSVEIIEDAAQSHGARSNGKCTGTLGRLGCFSFHPSKNLAAAGDAGAISTNDELLAERLRQMRSLGQAAQNEHVRIGLNSKLDAIQAAVLLSKLDRLDEWNRQRQALASAYRERLEDTPVAFQRGANLDDCVFHLFQLRTNQRDRLHEHLRQHGIDAVIRYPTPIHLQPAFQEFGWRSGQFPVAERLANELLCLPIRPDMPLAEVDEVCETVRNFFR